MKARNLFLMSVLTMCTLGSTAFAKNLECDNSIGNRVSVLEITEQANGKYTVTHTRTADKFDIGYYTEVLEKDMDCQFSASNGVLASCSGSGDSRSSYLKMTQVSEETTYTRSQYIKVQTSANQLPEGSLERLGANKTDVKYKNAEFEFGVTSCRLVTK